MHTTNMRPPQLMTAPERLDEVCALLASGMYRAWEHSTVNSAQLVCKSDLELGYSANQSVHRDVLSPLTESV